MTRKKLSLFKSAYADIPVRLTEALESAFEMNLFDGTEQLIEDYLRIALNNKFFTEFDRPKWLMGCYAVYLHYIDHRMFAKSFTLYQYLIAELSLHETQLSFSEYFRDTHVFNRVVTNLLLQTSLMITGNPELFGLLQYSDIVEAIQDTLLNKWLSPLNQEARASSSENLSWIFLISRVDYLVYKEDIAGATALLGNILQNASLNAPEHQRICFYMLYVVCSMFNTDYPEAMKYLGILEQSELAQPNDYLKKTRFRRFCYTARCCFEMDDSPQACRLLLLSNDVSDERDDYSEREIIQFGFSNFLLAITILQVDPTEPTALDALIGIKQALESATFAQRSMAANLVFYCFAPDQLTYYSECSVKIAEIFDLIRVNADAVASPDSQDKRWNGMGMG